MTYFYEEDKSIGLNPVAVKTVNTAAQSTPTTPNNFITINGSEVNYTPKENTTKVIYEIAFYVEALNKASFQHLVLEHDINNNGTWSVIDNRLGKNFGAFGAGNYVRDYLVLKFIIPSWSGSRSLRLRSSAHQNNYDVKYHQMTQWDGSSSSTTFCNTSLLVYSS